MSPNAVGRSGYLRVTLCRPATKKAVLVHHLVLIAFVGPRPEGFDGCHNDGNPANNCLDNLRWDTPSGNMRDKRKHGTDHNLRKTHCPKGHPYAGANLGRDSRGRVCRKCRSEKEGARQKRLRGTLGSAPKP
jgi:hypothetical protein